MTISENPSAAEIAAVLRWRALVWASEYYDDTDAEAYADWYARVQPPLSHVAAFARFIAERV